MLISLNYGLRLSDREEYGFEAMDLGNIAHQALERFARKAEQQDLKWTEMTEEKREELDRGECGGEHPGLRKYSAVQLCPK